MRSAGDPSPLPVLAAWVERWRLLGSQDPRQGKPGKAGGQLVFICMAHSQQAQARKGRLVLAGPATVTAMLSEASIQGKDQLWSLPASWGGVPDGAAKVGLWERMLWLWDRSHCHMPGNGGCHHSWPEHWSWTHASVSPELNAPIALGASEMGYFKQVPSKGSSVLLKQSHSLCLQLLMDKKPELCCFLFVWEREKMPSLSPPGKGHQPQTTSTSQPSITPPGPESSRLSWFSAGHPDMPDTICIRDDW